MGVEGYSEVLRRVVESFRRLPGVGERGAQRYALYLLYEDPEGARLLGEALSELARRRRLCSLCRMPADTDPCWICANPKRDRTRLCVVEQPQDVATIERSGAYDGLYFVLGGQLLKKRVLNEKIQEVIVATNPTTEGEATFLEICELLSGLSVTVSRIARGLPSGTYLHTAGPLAVKEALKNRKPHHPQA